MMSKISISQVLKTLGLPRPRSPKGKIICPVHRDKIPSLSLNLEKDVWYCHACGHGGGPVELYCFVKNVPREDALKALGLTQYSCFDDVCKSVLSADIDKCAIDFLERRKLKLEDVHGYAGYCNKQVIDKYSLRVKSHGIAFPLSNISLSYVGLQVWNPETKPRYCTVGKRGIFLASQYNNNRAFITDGCFDAISLRMLLPSKNSTYVATCGASLSSEQLQIITMLFREIIFIPDRKREDFVSFVKSACEAYSLMENVFVALWWTKDDTEKDIDEMRFNGKQINRFDVFTVDDMVNAMMNKNREDTIHSLGPEIVSKVLKVPRVIINAKA